jgi:hypothetical protein
VTATPKRRWYQFSLKALLAVMVPASVAIGWIASERNQVDKRDTAIAALQKLGGSLEIGPASPLRPSWLRPMLCDKLGGEVVEAVLIRVADADLIYLADLTTLNYLYLGSTQATDAGLVHVARLSELRSLSLDQVRVTDAGLVHLKRLTKLESLSLYGAQVTDAGVDELQRALPNCRIMVYR